MSDCHSATMDAHLKSGSDSVPTINWYFPNLRNKQEGCSASIICPKDRDACGSMDKRIEGNYSRQRMCHSVERKQIGRTPTIRRPRLRSLVRF